MRLGATLAHLSDAPPFAVARWADRLVTAGFESLWTPHIIGRGSLIPDPFVTLATAAPVSLPTSATGPPAANGRSCVPSRWTAGTISSPPARYSAATPGPASMTPSYLSDPVGQIRRRSVPCSRGNRRRPESAGTDGAASQKANAPLHVRARTTAGCTKSGGFARLHRSNRHGRSHQGRSRSHRDGGEAHPG